MVFPDIVNFYRCLKNERPMTINSLVFIAALTSLLFRRAVQQDVEKKKLLKFYEFFFIFSPFLRLNMNLSTLIVSYKILGSICSILKQENPPFEAARRLSGS